MRAGRQTHRPHPNRARPAGPKRWGQWSRGSDCLAWPRPDVRSGSCRAGVSGSGPRSSGSCCANHRPSGGLADRGWRGCPAVPHKAGIHPAALIHRAGPGTRLARAPQNDWSGASTRSA